jgi:hypothetical protein
MKQCVGRAPSIARARTHRDPGSPFPAGRARWAAIKVPVRSRTIARLFAVGPVTGCLIEDTDPAHSLNFTGGMDMSGADDEAIADHLKSTLDLAETILTSVDNDADDAFIKAVGTLAGDAHSVRIWWRTGISTRSRLGNAELASCGWPPSV